MTEPINLTQLREYAERANRPETEYADVQAMWEQLGPPTVLALIDIAEAAHKTVYGATGDPNAATVTIHGESFDRLREALARTTTNP